MDDSTIDPDLGRDRTGAGGVVVAGRVTGSRVALGGSIEPGRPRRRVPIVRIAAVLTVAALVVLALAKPTPAPPTPEPARSTADPFATPDAMAWSPDGSQLAYVIRTRAPLATGTAPSGTEGGETSASAPASGGASSSALAASSAGVRAVSFHVEIWLIRADGTDAHLLQRLAPAVDGESAWLLWSPDGAHLAVVRGEHPLEILPVDGSPAVTVRDSGSWMGGVQWARDGQSVLYVRGDGSSPSVWVAKLDGSAVRLSIAGNADGASWSPSGRLIVYSTYDDPSGEGLTWVAQPDGSSGHVVGPCCVVGWAPSGDVYIDDGGVIRAYPVSGSGAPGPVVETSGWQQTPAGWIGQRGDRLVLDAPDGQRTLTTPKDAALDGWFNPSPSGGYVAFLGRQAGRSGLFAVATDGHHAVSFLMANTGDAGTWSADATHPLLAVIHDRAILVIDPETTAVRTLVARDAIAGPLPDAAALAANQLVIGPDGPTADTITLSPAAANRFEVRNDSDVGWLVSWQFAGNSLCRGVGGPDGTLTTYLGTGPCVAEPHSTIALIPGPGSGQSYLGVRALGWKQGQDLSVILEPGP